MEFNKKRSRFLILLLGFIYFACQICRTDLSSALVDFIADLKISKETASIAITCGFISYAVGMFINSMIIDKINTKFAIALGMFGCAATHILIRTFPSLPVIIALWCVNGYILSMIISKVTGQTMEDYLDEKLFAPLKIRDYHSLKSPQGFDAGGWGLYLSTESLAKAGQFFLQKGNWNGKQLLAQEWFDTASYPHIMQYTNLIEDPAVLENLKNDQGFQGYGYQMWNCTDGAVRMHGANGQLAIIFPQQNAVVVTTAFSSDEQKLLDSIWKNIYPLL